VQTIDYARSSSGLTKSEMNVERRKSKEAENDCAPLVVQQILLTQATAFSSEKSLLLLQAIFPSHVV
jgi:hypothetical protein